MNNKELSQIQSFVEVAKNNSFSLAAEKLGMEKSTVSTKVKQLEQSLGVRLLFRTTRKVSLTEAGQRYFQQCQQAMNILSSAQNDILAMKKEPNGKLKIGAPYNLTSVLLNDMLPRYLQRYPKVAVEIIESNRIEDLTEGQFDIAIRSNKSQIPDSNLIYRKLFDTNWCIAANLERLKVEAPKNLLQLVDLPYIGCLNESLYASELHHKWIAENGIKYDLIPRFSVNNMKEAVKAAAQGLGFVIAPKGTVKEQIIQGQLTQLLPDLELPTSSMYLVYSSREGQTAKVSSFIEDLLDWRDGFIANTK